MHSVYDYSHISILQMKSLKSLMFIAEANKSIAHLIALAMLSKLTRTRQTHYPRYQKECNYYSLRYRSMTLGMRLPRGRFLRELEVKKRTDNVRRERYQWAFVGASGVRFKRKKRPAKVQKLRASYENHLDDFSSVTGFNQFRTCA